MEDEWVGTKWLEAGMEQTSAWRTGGYKQVCGGK